MLLHFSMLCFNLKSYSLVLKIHLKVLFCKCFDFFLEINSTIQLIFLPKEMFFLIIFIAISLNYFIRIYTSTDVHILHLCKSIILLVRVIDIGKVQDDGNGQPGTLCFPKVMTIVGQIKGFITDT